MVDINIIISDQERDAAGYFPPILCGDGSYFYVAAGLNRGSIASEPWSSFREQKGPWERLEVGFPNERRYNFEAIYQPVKIMTERKNLTALYVSVKLINKMINYNGGLGDINDVLRMLPRDGRSRFHVAFRDGRGLIINIGPKTMSCPPSLNGPWSRFEIQMKPGSADAAIRPHLGEDGTIGFMAASGVNLLARRYGGYLVG